MKYIDSNVLIHLITDSPKQTVLSIERVLDNLGGAEATILESVLVETCTLLEFNSRFGLSRTLICTELTAIFSRQAIIISPATMRAFETYKTHPKLDMADCLLAAHSDYRIDDVMTFDKDLLKILN